MASKYIYKFNIHDIFKTSDEQKIFIGSPKDHNNQFVIINILNNKRFLQQEVKEQLQLLDNLVYFEELMGGIVLVTSFKKAIYLSEYIKENKLNIDERLNIASQYLKGIIKYDSFTNDIKEMLVEESQLTIKDGNILLNELLIIEEEQIEINKETSFKKVAQKVGAVLKEILFSNGSFLNTKFNVSHEMIEFINNLEQGNHQYQNLTEIFNQFTVMNGSAVYPKYMSKEANGLWQEDYRIGSRSGSKKKKSTVMAVAMAATVFIGLTVGALSFGILGRSNSTEEQLQETLTYVNENQTEINDELTNNNMLDNEKENNQSLNEYNEVNYSLEGLEKYDISYLTPELVLIDQDIFRSGEYAVKIVGDRKTPIKNFSLHNIKTYDDSVFSLWIMTDMLEEIKFIFQGYDNNNHLKFDRSIFYTPTVAGEWEMIHFNLTAKDIITLETFIYSEAATIWIDDIKIDSYK